MRKGTVKKQFGYNIFYIAAFAITFIIGFFGNSFFAYEIFRSLFFEILFNVLIIAMLVVRSIQTFLRQTAIYGKVFTLGYYNLFAIVYAAKPFVSKRIWAIVLFCGFLVAAALLLILAFKYTKSPENYYITRVEPIIFGIVAILLLMFATLQSYTDAGGMWIPIVAGGVALAAIALAVFLKYFKNIDYFKFEHKSEFVMAIILLIAFCFYVAGVTVTTINYAFDHSPTAACFEIVDKRVQSGAMQVTAFYLEIEVNGREREITVPVEVYHAKEIGDSVEIKHYSGALGYGYYIYEYIGAD